MATRIYRKRFDCPFTTRACGGENCRCWDSYHDDCGMKYDGVSLEQLGDNVADIAAQLGELTRLFREIIIAADVEPVEVVKPVE